MASEATNSAPDGAEADERAHQLLRQVFDLNTVFDITCSLHAVMDTSSLLDGILMTAISQLGVGAAAVVIQESNQRDKLTNARWKGWSDLTPEAWAIDLKSDCARILKNLHGPVLIGDLKPLLDPNTPICRLMTRLGCDLVAPLKGHDCLRGVLFTTGKMNGQAFTTSDLQFIGLIVAQFAIAIENSVLYESERRYAEDLIQARDKLAQNEKMATLGRLAAAIAHEINNPLGIIRNYLQVIREAVADRPETHQSLDMVGAEVDRIARTVRQLLDAFHPDQGRPAAVDAGQVLNDVLDFMGPELNSNDISVTHTDFNDLPFVMGREDPLRQVFINLMLNAKDAMPDGGTLEITSKVDGQFVTFDFADEGTGIDPETADHLFDAYFSTKDSQRGTGLGLSICKSILEGFGGWIEAFSAEPPRTGALFRISLLRVDAKRDQTTGLKTDNHSETA